MNLLLRALCSHISMARLSVGKTIKNKEDEQMQDGEVDDTSRTSHATW